MTIEQPKEGNRRLRSSYASAIISISLVLFMLGLLGLLVLDARKISDYVKQHVQLNVFLQENVAEASVKAYQESLQNLPFVRSSRYVSKQEALDSLKKDLGEGAVGMLDSNPLPASIDINLTADYAHPDSLKLIKEFLSQDKIVREVVYQQTEVGKMNENFRTVAMIILVFCGLLFFVAIALINNTIRISMYSRRFTIKSMQLVGATRGFVRWPFLKRGFLHGIYAGLMASLLLGGVVYIINSRFPELGQLSDLRVLALLFGGILVLGFVISGISTFFAVNRYLRIKAEDLY